MAGGRTRIEKATRTAAEAPRVASRAKTKTRLVRGEPVVNGVLVATIEELARVGYRAFRIEEVALRAGVNKTTIYRRWPTKGELVREALACKARDKMVIPETGTLRTDLLTMGRTMVELSTSPEGQSVIRMLVAEGSDPEVADLTRSMRKEHEAQPKAMLASAVRRGELLPDVDHMVLVDAFVGAVHHKIFMMKEPATETFLGRLVDLLLLGALPRHAPRMSSPREAKTRTGVKKR
jgi:AcrR family transcriptional regulator